MISFEKSITTASGINIDSAYVEVTGVHIFYHKRILKVDVTVWTSEDARKAGTPPVPDPRIPRQIVFSGDDFVDPIQEMPVELERKVLLKLNDFGD